MMKEYSFRSMSLGRTLILGVISMILVIILSIQMQKLSESALWTFIFFLIMVSVFALLVKQFSSKNIHIKITDEGHFFVNHLELNVEDMVSYTFENTPYLEKCILTFPRAKLRFNVSKNSNEYLEFKSRLQNRIKQVNSQGTSRGTIKHKDFYNSKYSKLYAWLMILIVVAWGIAMILYPEKRNLGNFSLFLITISGFIPVILRIFKSTR